MDANSSAVKDLLRDISNFLSSTLAGENLSNDAQVQRDAIVQKLSMHFPEAINTPPPYIDMNGSSKGNNQSEEYVDVNTNQLPANREFYEEFPEHQPNQSLAQDDSQNAAANYENLSIPISKLREEARKFGPLYRKEKFLFMEHLIRCWGGILGDMFFIYSGDKDVKPSSLIHVNGFEARPAPAYFMKDAKKRDCCFELVCPGKKSLQFIARTIKDMEQWIVCINEASQRPASRSNLLDDTLGMQTPGKRQLPSPPSSESEYDDIHALDQDDEIYHDITDIRNDAQFSLGNNKSPPALSLIPKPSEEIVSDEDLLYDDIYVNNPSSVYYNMAGQRTTGISEQVQKAPLKSDKLGYTESEEDIYDDISVAPKPEVPKFRFAASVDSPSSIQHLVQKIEATLGANKKNLFKVPADSANSPAAVNTHIPSDDLYEPIDNL